MTYETKIKDSGLTIKFEIDKNVEDWIEFCLKYSDMFAYAYLGYFLFHAGTAHIQIDSDAPFATKLKFCCEYESLGKLPSKEETDEIIEAWKETKKLPKYWMIIDREVCLKAYAYGIAKDGASWYEEGDAITYGNAMQMALFGELPYG